MCRYAMVSYKPHYACFNCRKTFKRRLFYDIRKGPGYIPRDRDALLAYFKGIRESYEEQLKFFRNRTEPASKAEIQRDNDKNFYYICRIPSKLKSKNGFVKNEDAIDFWIGKIKEVEEKIAKI